MPLQDEILLRLEDVSHKSRGINRTPFRLKPTQQPLQDISLSVRAGVTLGIVGEAGAGKSALARIMTGWDRPNQGQVLYKGQDIQKLTKVERRWVQGRVRLMPQAHLASRGGRKTVAAFVADALITHGSPNRTSVSSYVAEALRHVGLSFCDPETPLTSLSRSDKLRISAARVIVTNPDLVIIDDPAWDMGCSVQLQLLTLFLDLQDRLDMTLVVVSSNLNIVQAMCDDLVIMKAGRIVESGSTRRVLTAPTHDYTRALVLRQGVDPSEIKSATPDLPIDPVVNVV